MRVVWVVRGRRNPALDWRDVAAQGRPVARFAGEMLGFALSAAEGPKCSCSGDRGAPGEEGRDHKVAFAEMVGDLEFHVHQAGVVTGEDARAVTERAGVVLRVGRGARRCAGTPGG